MRKEKICIYSNVLNENIIKEVDVYKRDEVIKYIKDNNIDLNDYALEVYAPYCLSCSIETLKKLDVSNEFFILEEDKEILLYLD